MKSMIQHNPLSALIALKACLSLLALAGLGAGQAWAQDQGLLTQAGHALGLTLTHYKYDEPGYMQLNAAKVGASYTGTHVFGTRWPDPGASWFLRTELHYGMGGADYHSPISGSVDNTPSRYVEARALVGKDIQRDGYVIAPYVGLGYRHLYSDIGYRRDSHYTTLPLGVTHKFKLSDRSQILTSVEYMHLIKGVQKAQLPLQSVSLDQAKGYGLRLQVLKASQKWSFGPTLTYWSLGESEVGGAIPVIEPRNKTLELGVKGQYHF